MSDFALVSSSNLGIEGDLVAEGQRYRETDTLETAIRLSLFTDARAEEGDELPEGSGEFGDDLRGYWADEFLTQGSSGSFGSKLWTLARSALTTSTRQRARDFALAALEWMLEIGVASRVLVSTEVRDGGQLIFYVEVHRPAETPARFSFLWERF